MIYIRNTSQFLPATFQALNTPLWLQYWAGAVFEDFSINWFFTFWVWEFLMLHAASKVLRDLRSTRRLFYSRSVVIQDSTALEPAREEGHGTPWRPGTCLGGGPEPLRVMPSAAAAKPALEVGLRDNSGSAWNPRSFPGAPWNTRTGQRESVLRVGYRDPLRRRRPAQGCSAGRPGSLRRSLRGGRRPEPGGAGKPCLRPGEKSPRGALTTVTPPARGRQGGRRGAARTAPRRRREEAAVPEGRGGAGLGAPGSLGTSRRFRLVRGVAAAKEGTELRCPEPGGEAARRRGGG